MHARCYAVRNIHSQGSGIVCTTLESQQIARMDGYRKELS